MALRTRPGKQKHSLKRQSPKKPPLVRSSGEEPTVRRILQELFDDFEVGVAYVTTSGETVYLNQKFAISLGLPPHRGTIGSNLHDLIEPHSWAALDSALRHAPDNAVSGEIQVDSVGGRRHTIRLSFSSASVLKQNLIRVVADEVTELVESNLRLSETETSLRALSGRILRVQDEERRKLARDLHDTSGQELAVLVMSLGQLADSLDQPGIDARKELLGASELARKINDDIRTLSYVLHPPLLDDLGLASALQWYVEGFQTRSNIEVSLVIPEELPRLSNEKEMALFRVVQEGLTNILRHSGSETARIVVCASVDEVELTVVDKGKGLSKAELGRLGAAAGAKSVGVGLAGLRERLRQFDGRLGISTNSQGTTLRAILPLKPGATTPASLADERSADAQAIVPEGPLVSTRPKRVLIVDDHEVMRRGIRDLLSSYSDLEVCGEAPNGAEAVLRVHELHPDLVILDLNMPVAGGISAANQLRKLAVAPAILIFSMHTLPGIERVVRMAGCKGMVSKVHAERDLLRAIRTILAGGEFFGESSAASRAPSPTRAQSA